MKPERPLPEDAAGIPSALAAPLPCPGVPPAPLAARSPARGITSVLAASPQDPLLCTPRGVQRACPEPVEARPEPVEGGAKPRRLS